MLMCVDGLVVGFVVVGVVLVVELLMINVCFSVLCVESYCVLKEVGVLCLDILLFDIVQVVNIVFVQVLCDQWLCNFDDVFGNVSGIMQGNMFVGMQDMIMKCGFGGNCDGLIMQNGMLFVQGCVFNVVIDSVEVLKGLMLLLYGLMDLGGVVNVVSKQLQFMCYNVILFGVLMFGYGKNGGSVIFDLIGLVGDLWFVYWLIVDQLNEQYWCNFGEYWQIFVVLLFVWYGCDMQVVVLYQYCKFYLLFDCGIVFDLCINVLFDIFVWWCIDELFNNMDGELYFV